MRPSGNSPPGGPAGPLRFRAIFKEKVWGGRRLETVLGKRLPGPGPYGECWEISDCGPDVSVVEGGAWDGRDLRQVVAEAPEAVLGHAGRGFPLLLKTIDTEARLSVQLHPGEEDAEHLRPGERGKSEAWVILKARPGAKIVHGLSAGADREAFFDLVEAGEFRAAERLLSFRLIRRGDVVFLPAGTIHMIGAGLLLLEVQESSDLTYRIHDWGRVGLDGRPRALHLREARAVRARPAETPQRYPNLAGPGKVLEPLLECAPFRIDALRLGPSVPTFRGTTREADRSRFLVLGGVLGRGAVAIEEGGPECEVGPGSFVLLPAQTGEFRVEARAPSFTGILVREGYRAP